MDAKYYRGEIKRMLDDVEQESALELFFALMLSTIYDSEAMEVLTGPRHGQKVITLSTSEIDAIMVMSRGRE